MTANAIRAQLQGKSPLGISKCSSLGYQWGVPSVSMISANYGLCALRDVCREIKICRM